MGDDAGAQKHHLTHLVILCCHAVYHGARGSDPRLESNWALKPFQRGSDTKSGEHETFLQHGFAALQQYCAPHTAIVLTGGPTDASYPQLSEARSYMNALHDWADAIGYTLPADAVSSALYEEAATDSYQNLLFSVLAFRRSTGYYPAHVTLVTHAFKSDRFLHLHAKAMRWPADRIKVVGINPPFTSAELEDTVAGEKRNGYTPWETDLYGTTDVLDRKRKARGWSDELSTRLGEGLEPVVQRLLLYEGRDQVFPETMPWE